MTHLSGFSLPKDLKTAHLVDKFASENKIRIHFICWNTFWQAYTRYHFKNGISGNLIFFYPYLRTFFHCLFFFKRERKRERERDINAKEKNWLFPYHTCPEWRTYKSGPGTSTFMGNGTYSLGMCLTGNWTWMQPFSYGTTFQPTEPHWSGQQFDF